MPGWPLVSFLCCIYYVLIVGGNANHFPLVKLLIPMARSLVASDSVKISKRDIGCYGRAAKMRNSCLLKQIGALPGWSPHCDHCNRLALTWPKWPGVFSWENICLLPSCMNHCLHTCQKHLSSEFTCPNGDLSGKHESLPVFVSHPAKS